MSLDIAGARGWFIDRGDDEDRSAIRNAFNNRSNGIVAGNSVINRRVLGLRRLTAVLRRCPAPRGILGSTVVAHYASQLTSDRYGLRSNVSIGGSHFGRGPVDQLSSSVVQLGPNGGLFGRKNYARSFSRAERGGI